MEDNFNKHLGNKLKLRRLALGLTQTKVAKAINVTFQQIQKYEKGTNGVSSIRLLQLSNYLKVPINYFFEDFSEYAINAEKIKENHMHVNYNFLLKHMATWRNGYAEDCKSLYPGSIPGVASKKNLVLVIKKSKLAFLHSSVAQLVEQLTVNQLVAGSSPARGAKILSNLSNL